MRKRVKLTDEDIEFLQNNIGVISDVKLAEKLGVSVPFIHQRRHALKIPKAKLRRYTPEDISAIAKMWKETKDIKAVANHVGVSVATIHSNATKWRQLGYNFPYLYT